MNCTICDHPLIDHGYGENDACDCCAGRVWKKDDNPRELVVQKSSSEVRLPRGYRVCEEFPDYMVNKQGTVKHIATGKFCFLVRLADDGGALLHIRRDGSTHIVSAQKLRSAAFG